MIIWKKNEFGSKLRQEQGRNRFFANFEMDGLATNLDDSRTMIQDIMEIYVDMCKELMLEGKKSDGTKYPARNPDDKMPNSEFPRRVSYGQYVAYTNSALEGNVDVKKSSGSGYRRRVRSWILQRWIKRAKKKYTFRGKVYELRVRPRPMISGLAYAGITISPVQGKGVHAKIRINVPKQRMAYFTSQKPLDLRSEPLREFERAVADYMQWGIYVHKAKTNKIEVNGHSIPGGKYLNDKLLQAVIKNLKRRIARKMKTLMLASL